MPDELIILHKNQGSLGFYDLTRCARPVSVSVDRPTGSAFVSTLNDEVCVVALDTLAMKVRIKTRAGPDPTAVIRH